MESLANFGYPGLLISAFLAATVLPVSSEVVLSILLLKGLDPTTLVAVATFGNVAGAFTNYAIGLWGGVVVVKKVLRMSAQEFELAIERFRKYGTFSLLFAWMPIIGDPLTVAAGFLKVNVLLFLLLVTAGKLIRYIFLTFVVSSF